MQSGETEGRSPEAWCRDRLILFPICPSAHSTVRAFRPSLRRNPEPADRSTQPFPGHAPSIVSHFKNQRLGFAGGNETSTSEFRSGGARWSELSCNTRNRAISIAAGNRSTSGAKSIRTFIPLRLAKPATYHCAARSETGFVQHGRMEQVGSCTNFLKRLIRQTRDSRKLVAGSFVFSSFRCSTEPIFSTR